MTDKLSDKLWEILNEAAVRNALTVEQLCTIDAARALAKRVEDAPVGELSASLLGVDVRDVDIRILAWHGKRVRVVLEGE